MPVAVYYYTGTPKNLAPGIYTIGEGANNNVTIKYGFYGVEATATAGTLEILEDNMGFLWTKFDAIATDSEDNQYNLVEGETYINQ